MMMRLVALLGAVSLLVCHSAGLDAADVEDQDEFVKPYAADSSYSGLNALLGNNAPRLHSATKRQQSDRQQEIDEAAKMPFYPYGRRTDVPGFVFGKRGQYFIPIPFEKREMDEVNPYSVAKRDDELTGLEEYQASKRSGPYSMTSGLTFGKRDVLEPEKRNLFGSYNFGKRALGNSFTFGKRGMGVSSFSFGKRSGLEGDQMMPEDKRAFGDFSFGKRVNGLSSFTFGKRDGER